MNDSKVKIGFFKKIWYSIDKIEKYPELSAEGFLKAFKYLLILVLMLSLVSTFMSLYQTNGRIQNIAKYVNENSPEFTYKDGILQTDNDEVVVKENNEYGKIIIDTKTEDEEQIKQYSDKIRDKESAIIILKDKFMIKESFIGETREYSYKEFLDKFELKEFNKQELIEYLTSSKMIKIYTNLFSVLFLYALVVSLIDTLFYVVLIALVGYLTTKILKLKIKFVAVFNMAVYATTLPILLNMVYIIVNAIFKYTISYFDIIYVLISSIYTIAALFILKSDFNKKQGEVQKIIDVENEIKKEIKNEENNKLNDKEKENENEDGQQDKKNDNEPEESGT